METIHSAGGRAKSKGIKTISVPEDEPVREKWCYQCRKYRPVSNIQGKSGWYSNIHRPDGLGTQCKYCDNRNRTIRRQNASKRFVRKKQK